MSAHERWQAGASRPDPKPMGQLTREQVAARIHVLREAVHACWIQRDLDGGAHYECIGAMKSALIQLEMELQRRDRPQPVSSAPLPLPVALAVVAQSAADPKRVAR